METKRTVQRIDETKKIILWKVKQDLKILSQTNQKKGEVQN
jgi:hypothetical protein